MKNPCFAIMASAALCLFTACTKTMDVTPVTETQAAAVSAAAVESSNSNSPIVETHTYPIYGRDGNIVAYAHIDGERGGLARVYIEVVDQWFFYFGQTYDVALYNGKWYTDVYAQLNVLTSDTASWTTFPVKDANGKVLHASDLLQGDLRIKINAPYETVGIGQIQ